jgi:hypothetical protein
VADALVADAVQRQLAQPREAAQRCEVPVSQLSQPQQPQLAQLGRQQPQHLGHLRSEWGRGGRRRLCVLGGCAAAMARAGLGARPCAPELGAPLLRLAQVQAGRWVHGQPQGLPGPPAHLRVLLELHQRRRAAQLLQQRVAQRAAVARAGQLAGRHAVRQHQQACKGGGGRRCRAVSALGQRMWHMLLLLSKAGLHWDSSRAP